MRSFFTTGQMRLRLATYSRLIVQARSRFIHRRLLLYAFPVSLPSHPCVDSRISLLLSLTTTNSSVSPDSSLSRFPLLCYRPPTRFRHPFCFDSQRYALHGSRARLVLQLYFSGWLCYGKIITYLPMVDRIYIY